MPDLHIERHRARYHLGSSRVGDRDRLDAIAGAIFEDRSGSYPFDPSWGESEEVCIRRLHVVVQIDLGTSDRFLAERWGVAIADAIRRAAASPSESVVRYPSRRLAVLDMVRSICRDDRRREWAWRQLGLMPHGAGSRAGDQVEHALLDDPREVVPLLAGLARDGLLPRVDALLDSPAWWRIAQAAAHAAGVILPPAERTVKATAPGADARSESILSKSRIARALSHFDSRALTSGQGRWALSVLLVLEADPAILVLATDRALGVAAAIRDVLATTGFVRALRSSPDQGAIAGDPPASQDGDRDSQERRQASTSDTGQRAALPDELARRGSEFDEPAASAATPARNRTHWGGLLYLIHLLARLGIPAQVVNHPTLGERGLAWVLHQLALSLGPVESVDPAALAFSGLAPSSTPPDQAVAPPAPAELETLTSLRSMLVAELREALERRLDDEELLVTSVTRREAEITGSPGWLDVHMPLDAVSMEVRRAGLDLDPGYVPWLGAVVRFRYE
jgi:hypothetical protein